MAIFQPETVPIFTYETAAQLNEHFQQRPQTLPLTAQPNNVYIMRQPESNIVPIIAIVGVLSLFGFLAFLAFLKR